MTDILNIFSGNPLSTFIGKKIEAATCIELESEDWGLNLEICDYINENDDDGKDAIRAIRKRLQQVDQDTNFTITNRTLTVLETCVNNCSHRFHVLAMQKEFVQELVRLIGPKNNPPIDLQERVLRMIQRWADAFKSQPDLSGVVTVYNELKSKGVTFPSPDSTLSNAPPIRTPQRTVPPRETLPRSVGDQQRSMVGAGAGAGQPSRPVGVPIVLEGEGYNKITQDLNVVKTSLEMFTEIIQVIESDNEQADWTLADDLNTTCRQMKDRIVELIEQVANEDLTIELLTLNDELNNIFIKYDRLVRNKEGRKTSTNPESNPSGRPTTSRIVGQATGTDSHLQQISTTDRPTNEPSLIDFDESGEEIMDPFAPTSKKDRKPQQSEQRLADDLNRISLNNLHTTTRPPNSTPSGTMPKEISNLKEQDFAEIENWLSSDAGREATSSTSDQAGPPSLASPEFENFIASRAMAGSSDKQGKSNQKEPAT